MQQIRQANAKFMGFKAYATHVFATNGSLNDFSTLEAFLKNLNAEITASLDDAKFLFGHRTEAMFGALVVSIGAVKLLKQEDGTDCYAEDASLQIPDYRVIFSTGEEELIEAKNFHQGHSGIDPYTMKPAYLEGLQRYADLMRCPLKIAIFWSRWELWTLVPPTYFKLVDGKMAITMDEALKHNEMNRLGDVMIGSKIPLRFSMKLDHQSEEKIEPGKEFTARISEVSIFCDGQLLTDPVEERIALFMMLNGKLTSTENLEQLDQRIVEINYKFTVSSDEELETYKKQGFTFVGSLSSMFSNFYRYATSDDQSKLPKQIHAHASPGLLGQMIPQGFKSKNLPLWIFHIQANHTKTKKWS